MKLVASMIVRNELGRYLPLAVKHLRTFCDEIRVLDDNSDDGTFEWLDDEEQFLNGVRVLRNVGPAFFEYESKARQYLLEWTMEAEPDYVLSIDADEFIDNPNRVKRVITEMQKPVYTLDMIEVWNATPRGIQIRVDGHWGPRKCPILWRAPEKLDGYWYIPDRKLACGREPLAVRRAGFEPCGANILHFGWTNKAARQARYDRYAEHDQGKFHKDAHLQSIMWGDDRVRVEQRNWPANLRGFSRDLLERVRQ